MNTAGKFEPFRASKFWQEMQLEFQNRVPRVCIHLRSRKVEDVFSGKVAVETLYSFLKEKERTDPFLGLKEVTRDKVVKLCQCWLKEGLFEIILLGTEKSGDVFEDSCQTQYKFVDKRQLSSMVSVLSPAIAVSTRGQSPLLQRKLNLTPVSAQVNAMKAGIMLSDEHHEKKKKSPFNYSSLRLRSRKIRDENASETTSEATEDVQMCSPSRPLSVEDGSIKRASPYLNLIGFRRGFPQRGVEESDCFSADTDREISAISGLTVDTTSSLSFDGDDSILEQVDEALLHDVALFRLLTLVEVNMLEGIIHVKEQGGGGFIDQLVSKFSLNSIGGGGSNPPARKESFLQRKLSIKKTAPPSYIAPLSRDDKWLVGALACLPEVNAQELYFEFQNKTKNVAPTQSSQRRFLFQKVSEEYQKITKDGALIGNNLEDLVVAIFQQHLSRKHRDTSLEACQLLLLLLSSPHRDILRSLLAFLSTIVQDEKENKLSSDLSNMDVCLNALSKCIICCPSLPHAQILQLLEFMVGCGEELFEWPSDLKKEIVYRLTRSTYTVAEPEPQVAYCKRISPVEFREQTLLSSEVALVDLANKIMDDTAMPLKKKTQWLDNFKTQYPAIYYDHFRNLEW